jgi:exopolyphosphatase/guanosine-5'-triphosphate,3'-diphosphate pyrophosphatase
MNPRPNPQRQGGHRRVAAIDIGSNSVRLVVADALPGDQFRVIDEERRSTRLARKLGSTGRLDHAAVEDTLECLRHFKKLAEGLGVDDLQTIATCAVREATDGDLFVQRALDEAGLDVEAIPANDEALYAFRSVQRAFDISDRNTAVVDIGGGSTEIVLASAGYVEKIHSTRLGAVRMTELFGRGGGLFGDDYSELVRQVDRELKKKIKKKPFVPQMIYGTGGTFTSLASMIIESRNEDSQMLWGYRITRADVRHMLDRVSGMSAKERRSVPGLSADRADIIVAGIVIVDRIMARLKTNILRVHTGGVRDGLLLSMIDSLPGQKISTTQRTRSVEDFATNCGADINHARHVARLAGNMFDRMKSTPELSEKFFEGDRDILTHAALLQDVGYLINYKQHHKHSYQLIVNGNLPGFRRHELELVANVARYHRGAKPKNKHTNFRKLPKSDRRRVERLSAILRVAGALDRGHMQRVHSLDVNVGPNQIGLEIQADEDVALELWAARGKSELFDRAFDRQLVIYSTNEGRSLSDTLQSAAQGTRG